MESELSLKYPEHSLYQDHECGLLQTHPDKKTKDFIIIKNEDYTFIKMSILKAKNLTSI